MRTSVVAVALGAVGALVGGWLVARWCLGLVLIGESAGAAAWGLFRDDGTTAPVQALRPGIPLADVLERARRAP